jgi:RNA methyltransferase, TrmH family
MAAELPLLSLEKRKLLRLLGTRQGRRKSDYLVVEGLRCAREALRQRPEWLLWAVLVGESPVLRDAALQPLLARHRHLLFQVSEGDFAELAQTENPQGILLVMRRPPAPVSAPTDPFLVVLDRLADPGNLGTILRTAWAAGLRRVLWTTGGTDPWGAKALRAGMGAQFYLDLQSVGDLAATRAWAAPQGYPTLWLAEPQGGLSCFDPAFDPRGGLLVLGNEAHGVSEVTGARTLTIPMPGPAESLNVAQAAAIILFAARQRLPS